MKRYEVVLRLYGTDIQEFDANDENELFDYLDDLTYEINHATLEFEVEEIREIDPRD